MDSIFAITFSNRRILDMNKILGDDISSSKTLAGIAFTDAAFSEVLKSRMALLENAGVQHSTISEML